MRLGETWVGNHLELSHSLCYQNDMSQEEKGIYHLKSVGAHVGEQKLVNGGLFLDQHGFRTQKVPLPVVNLRVIDLPTSRIVNLRKIGVCVEGGGGGGQ